jgi:hypothetical protein
MGVFTTTPRDWVAGEKPPAATLNAHIRDPFDALFDPWTSFTSTTTNITLGNGTLTSAYRQFGKSVDFRIKLTFGSTSAITGAPTFTLPVSATAARTVNAPALMYDSSEATATAYKVGMSFNSTVNALLVRSDASAAISSTVPFTWATSDELVITGTYEAA